MSREEKRRKLHEAVLNTLYPPPPSPPSQSEDEDKPLNTLGYEFDVERINPDDYWKGSSSASDDESEDGCEPKKLSRAQRKRLRKKKLKQDASRRGNTIGPLLPPTSYYADDKCDDSVVVENESPGILQNAADGIDATSERPGESSACTNQDKLKQRRMAKRLAREKSKFSSTENCDQQQSFKSSKELDEFHQDQNLKSFDKLGSSDCLSGGQGGSLT